jgi:hypothetical protein
MGMKRVVVHIDRLVLTGFRPEDRYAIASGLQAQLGSIFADRETLSGLQALGDVPRLKVGGVAIDQGARPQRVGENVAQGIGRELKQ